MLYFTIKEATEALYKEKASKFYSYAFPVASEHEIKEKLDELSKKHPQAKHHCYAWILGFNEKSYRVNDAGEPKGTAGLPIYNQILSKQLTNILIVVVRYFGGTKLGKSGLIQAYKWATLEALNQAQIIECKENSCVTLIFPFAQLNEVLSKLKILKAKILHQEIDEKCMINFSLEKNSWLEQNDLKRFEV